MNAERPTFSIFIPAYNAEKTLPGVLARIPRETMRSVKSVWIVNDGSTDGTWSAVEKAAAENDRIKGINLEKNRGYGGALKAALSRLAQESPDVAVCLHADGQYAPEEIPAMLDELHSRKLDLLQGSRIAGGTALAGGMPLYKYVAGKMLTALENLVFRTKMTDRHSGFLVYGRRTLETMNFAALSDSFDFDLEVIASAVSLKLSVAERPIPTSYGGEVSHLNPLTYGLRVLRVLWRYLNGRYSRLHAPERRR
ncbi:MAG TPA: glycosyltransferase family 2 protein [Planctomycetes bacterium]|nr:glycosyltransferase family 2 protein [Planctomycetota bacterium]